MQFQNSSFPRNSFDNWNKGPGDSRSQPLSVWDARQSLSVLLLVSAGHRSWLLPMSGPHVPHYVGTETNQTVNSTSNPGEPPEVACLFNITFVPPMQIPLVIHRNGGWMYFQDPETSWLACSNGLTKCASSELFTLEEKPLLLLLMHVIPQVFICNTKEGRDHPSLDSELPCAWRAMLILTPLLVGEGPTSAGT